VTATSAPTVPEFPHVTVYRECLEASFAGRALEGVRLGSPFLLRSVDPPLDAFTGRRLVGVRTIGKRLVFDFGEELFFVLHLMIAGRLHRKAPGAAIGGKATLASFDFAGGALVLTEAGSKRRASLTAVEGEAVLEELDPRGLDVFEVDAESFREAMTRKNHTLKRALTDPRILSGIGNAFSDEILHAARLSPVQLTSNLKEEEWQRLRTSTREVLETWVERLRSELRDGWPAKVSAFHPAMAVHGRYREPCPDCGSPVQRIVYASRETNYCPACQTGGRLLADRALSRLLKSDWPRTLEELEERA